MLLAPQEHKKEERFFAITFCLIFIVILQLFTPRILPRYLETGGCCLRDLPVYDPVDDVTDGKCDYSVPWE